MDSMRKLIDIVEGNLFEKHYSGPLYHSTTYMNASNIIKDGSFRLSDATHEEAHYEEKRHIPGKGYVYYLSTSRMKDDEYTRSTLKNVTFVLDPRKLQQSGYKINQVNYFRNPSHRDEAEERVWSRDDRIPLKGLVTEIHMLMESYDEQSDDDGVDYWMEAQGDLVHYSMKTGIPVYMYPSNQKKAFFKLNKKFAYVE